MSQKQRWQREEMVLINTPAMIYQTMLDVAIYSLMFE